MSDPSLASSPSPSTVRVSFGQAVLRSAPSHYTAISTIALAPPPQIGRWPGTKCEFHESHLIILREREQAPAIPSAYHRQSQIRPPTRGDQKKNPPVSSMHSGFCSTQRPAVRIEDRTKPDFLYHCARRAEIGNCGHSSSIRSDINSADLNTRQRRSNGPKVLIPLNSRDMLRRLSLSINLSVHVIADTLCPRVSNTAGK